MFQYPYFPYLLYLVWVWVWWLDQVFLLASFSGYVFLLACLSLDPLWLAESLLPGGLQTFSDWLRAFYLVVFRPLWFSESLLPGGLQTHVFIVFHLCLRVWTVLGQGVLMCVSVGMSPGLRTVISWLRPWARWAPSVLERLGCFCVNLCLSIHLSLSFCVCTSDWFSLCLYLSVCVSLCVSL